KDGTTTFAAAGRDGMVDRRGGLVLQIGGRVNVFDKKVMWGDWALQGWRAETEDPANWAPIEGASHPERFRFVHKDTGAELVAAVMPLKSDARDAREAPLKTHA